MMAQWIHTAVAATWLAWVVGVTSWRIPRSDDVASCAFTRCEIERRQKAYRKEAMMSSEYADRNSAEL